MRGGHATWPPATGRQASRDGDAAGGECVAGVGAVDVSVVRRVARELAEARLLHTQVGAARRRGADPLMIAGAHTASLHTMQCCADAPPMLVAVTTTSARAMSISLNKITLYI